MRAPSALSEFPVETFDGAHDVFIEEAGVDLGGADAGVTELFLDKAEVVAARLVEMRPVGVTETVDAEVRADPGAFDASLERLLEGPLCDRLAGDLREDVVLPLRRLADVSLGF